MEQQSNLNDEDFDDEDWDDPKTWRLTRPPRTTPPIIDRRVLPSGEVEEWERNPTIPDDFIYDPETHAYYAPGEPVNWDIEAELREFEEARRRGDFGDGRLISVDELRAAGALVTPETRRKTLGGGPPKKQQLDLFDAMLGDDDEADEGEPEPEDDDDREAED
jgi:hypothetical protein